MSTVLTREQWLEERKKGIGGSDAPVVLGLNPWKSRMDLWLEKTGQYEEQVDNEAMYWGRTLEDVVAREFCQRTGKKVRRRNDILYHPELPFVLASVDRLVVGEKAGLECKTVNAFYQDDGTCPPMYYAQVQHYMFVTGYPLWYVAVLAGGQRFYIYEVPRSEEYIEQLLTEEAVFWQLVMTGQPPELDGTEASTKVVSRMYPEAAGEEKELPEAYELIRQYEEAAEEEKQAKLKKDEAANRIRV